MASCHPLPLPFPTLIVLLHLFNESGSFTYQIKGAVYYGESIETAKPHGDTMKGIVLHGAKVIAQAGAKSKYTPFPWSVFHPFPLGIPMQFLKYLPSPLNYFQNWSLVAGKSHSNFVRVLCYSPRPFGILQKDISQPKAEMHSWLAACPSRGTPRYVLD